MALKEDVLYKPFSLKRLTDNNPSEQSEGDGALITSKQLRDDVYDNIDMLFNSRTHASLADLNNCEELDESVLGYGISDFCGKQSSTISRQNLRDQIYRQICLFEPRLDPQSLVVEFLDKAKDAISLEFHISGKIKVKEVNEEVSFISRLNLESGFADLVDAG